MARPSVRVEEPCKGVCKGKDLGRDEEMGSLVYLIFCISFNLPKWVLFHLVYTHTLGLLGTPYI